MIIYQKNFIIFEKNKSPLDSFLILGGSRTLISWFYDNKILVRKKKDIKLLFLKTK